MARPRTTSTVLGTAGLAWVVAVGAGLAAIPFHEWTPGRPGEPGPGWPAQSRLRLDRQCANLVRLAHPRCPCTRASLDGLRRIMARRRLPVTARILFFRPKADAGQWGRGELYRRAEAIPGVEVLEDPGGVEARRFGAETSGTVLLYDRHGGLLFARGIIPARGRAGENAGIDAALVHLGGATVPASTAVFGSPIHAHPDVGEGP